MKRAAILCLLSWCTSHAFVIEERAVSVVQQTGDDCGLHAAYNAACDDQLTGARLEMMRNASDSATALTPQDVFKLAIYHFGMDPQTFTLLPNVQQLVPRQGVIDPIYLVPILGEISMLSSLYQSVQLSEGISILAAALDNLRTIPGAEHTFILGNIQLIYITRTGGYGGTDDGAHWIAVRARNEAGTIVLYTKDSQHGNGGTRVMIESLKKIIQDTDTRQLRGQLSICICQG